MAMSPFILGGGGGLAYGMQPRRAPQQAPPTPMPQVNIPQRPNTAGIAEVLGNPVTVESGTWGEAIAEMLAAGLRGNAARSERDAEMWGENQEMKRGQARDQSIEQALAGFDPSNPQAMVQALSQDAPEQALDLATLLARSQASAGPAEMWSDPFDLGGAQVQRNEGTNQYRSIVPRPVAPRAAPNASPELPPGFVWAE